MTLFQMLDRDFPGKPSHLFASSAQLAHRRHLKGIEGRHHNRETLIVNHRKVRMSSPPPRPTTLEQLERVYQMHFEAVLTLKEVYQLHPEVEVKASLVTDIFTVLAMPATSTSDLLMRQFIRTCNDPATSLDDKIKACDWSLFRLIALNLDHALSTRMKHHVAQAGLNNSLLVLAVGEYANITGIKQYIKYSHRTVLSPENWDWLLCRLMTQYLDKHDDLTNLFPFLRDHIGQLGWKGYSFLVESNQVNSLLDTGVTITGDSLSYLYTHLILTAYQLGDKKVLDTLTRLEHRAPLQQKQLSDVRTMVDLYQNYHPLAGNEAWLGQWFAQRKL